MATPRSTRPSCKKESGQLPAVLTTSAFRTRVKWLRTLQPLPGMKWWLRELVVTGSGRVFRCSILIGRRLFLHRSLGHRPRNRMREYVLAEGHIHPQPRVAQGGNTPMPQSLTKLYAHLIFSTKNRERWLDDWMTKSDRGYPAISRRRFATSTRRGSLWAASRTTCTFYLTLARKRRR